MHKKLLFKLSCFFFLFCRKEQNTTVITTEYAVPRGTTQSTGVDHKALRLRYQWGPVSTNKALLQLLLITDIDSATCAVYKWLTCSFRKTFSDYLCYEQLRCLEGFLSVSIAILLLILHKTDQSATITICLFLEDSGHRILSLCRPQRDGEVHRVC